MPEYVTYTNRWGETRTRRKARKPLRVRDGQQKKAYKAEDAIFRNAGWRNKADLSGNIQCAIWINRVCRNERARAAVDKAGGRLPSAVTVKSQTIGAHAKPWFTEISVAPTMRYEWVLLHELAHLCHRNNSDKTIAGHGREWAAFYLALVGAVLGTAKAKQLRLSFRKHGVKFKPKRTLSPERKAALAARLTAMRQQKAAIAAMSDDEYLEHNASKHDGAISIDDPRALDIVVRQQDANAVVPVVIDERDRKLADLLIHQRAMDVARALSES